MILSCLRKPKRRWSTIINRWDRCWGNNSWLAVASELLSVPSSHTQLCSCFCLPGPRASVHCPSAWPRLTCLCPTCLTRKGLPLDSFCRSGMFVPALEPVSSIHWWERYVPWDCNWGVSNAKMSFCLSHLFVMKFVENWLYSQARNWPESIFTVYLVFIFVTVNAKQFMRK